ncbi:MAG: S-layer homology domain-containing protein [Peptoniphilaceae bacterium]
MLPPGYEYYSDQTHKTYLYYNAFRDLIGQYEPEKYSILPFKEAYPDIAEGSPEYNQKMKEYQQLLSEVNDYNNNEYLKELENYNKKLALFSEQIETFKNIVKNTEKNIVKDGPLVYKDGLEAKPLLEDNYQGTNRQALIWKLNPIIGIDRENNGYALIRGDLFTLSFYAKVVDPLLEEDKNDIFLNVEGHEIFKEYTRNNVLNNYPDKYDIDKDGNSLELIGHADSTFYTKLPGLYKITKTSKGSLDKNYVRSPLFGQSEIGDSSFYRISIFKNLLDDLKIDSISIVDVLPYKGDSNGSDYDIFLRAPIEINGFDKFNQGISDLSEFKTYYSTNRPFSGESIEDFSKNNSQWTSNIPSNLEDVKSIKIVYTKSDKSEYIRSARYTFDIPVTNKIKVSNIYSSRSELNAINKIYYRTESDSTNENATFSVSNNSTLKIFLHGIKGKAFLDENENGVFDSNEQVLSNKEITVLDENGNPLKSSSGNVIKAITDNNGDYFINLPINKKIKIKVDKGDNKFTYKKDLSIKNGNHINSDGMSDIFELTPSKKFINLNVGYVERDLIIDPPVKDDPGDDVIINPPVEDDEPIKEPIILRGTTIWTGPSKLNTEKHYAYIIGYPDGSIRPNGNITRAEVATIFFRLLKEDIKTENMTQVNNFNDVNNNDWFSNAISTMGKMSIVKGYKDNNFKPNENITRAEFAAIAARFADSSPNSNMNFSDINGHWSADHIKKAAALGWIKGYPDGTFKPEKDITRSEAVTLINRVLSRIPENETDLLDDMIKWSDNMDINSWYYVAIQEATNSHNYIRKSNKSYEKWVELIPNRDWSKLEK